MNLDKTKRVLYREFTKNPLKTGVLLVLCPVALYFLVPLVWPGKDKETKQESLKKAQLVQAIPQASVAAVNNVSLPASPETDWHDLLRWIEADGYMLPAPPEELRDPFERPRIEKPVEVAEKEEPEASSKKIVEVDRRTPEQVGIALTATVVGPLSRLATISGKTYQENSLIPVTDGDDSPGSPNPGFRLVRVLPRSVVLERWEKQYVLRLPGPQLGDTGSVTLRVQNP